MSGLTRDGTAKPISRDRILRRERGQGNIHFPRSADHEQDWQLYPVGYRTTVGSFPISYCCGDRETFIFPVQLTTSRIGNYTRWIHNNGRIIPDIILLTLTDDYHWGNQLNPMRFSCSTDNSKCTSRPISPVDVDVNQCKYCM